MEGIDYSYPIRLYEKNHKNVRNTGDREFGTEVNRRGVQEQERSSSGNMRFFLGRLSPYSLPPVVPVGRRGGGHGPNIHKDTKP